MSHEAAADADNAPLLQLELTEAAPAVAGTLTGRLPICELWAITGTTPEPPESMLLRRSLLEALGRSALAPVLGVTVPEAARVSWEWPEEGRRAALGRRAGRGRCPACQVTVSSEPEPTSCSCGMEGVLWVWARVRAAEGCRGRCWGGS